MIIEEQNLRLDLVSIPTELDVNNIFKQVLTELKGFSPKNVSLASSLVLAEVELRLQNKIRFSISFVGSPTIFPGDKVARVASWDEPHWWENTTK